MSLIRVKYNASEQIVCGDVATVEISLNNVAISTWKLKRSLVTFRHGGPFLNSLLAL